MMSKLPPKAELYSWCLKNYGASSKLIYESTQFSVNPPTFSSTLTIPDGRTFLSAVCSKKKDAEHSASQKALLEIKGLTEEQLQEVPPELSEEEKWQNLRSRLEVTFKDEVIKSYCPLKSHFAAAVRRGDKHGAVPLGVLCALDLRLLSACKALDPLCAFQLDRAAALVCTAATAAPVEEESVVLLLRHISSFSNNTPTAAAATAAAPGCDGLAGAEAGKGQGHRPSHTPGVSEEEPRGLCGLWVQRREAFSDALVEALLREEPKEPEAPPAGEAESSRSPGSKEEEQEEAEKSGAAPLATVDRSAILMPPSCGDQGAGQQHKDRRRSSSGSSSSAALCGQEAVRSFKAVKVPCDARAPVETVTLEVQQVQQEQQLQQEEQEGQQEKGEQPQQVVGEEGGCLQQYFLDVIARALGCCNAGALLLSRCVGNASSGMRFYSPLLLPPEPVEEEESVTRLPYTPPPPSPSQPQPSLGSPKRHGWRPVERCSCSKQLKVAGDEGEGSASVSLSPRMHEDGSQRCRSGQPLPPASPSPADGSAAAAAAADGTGNASALRGGESSTSSREAAFIKQQQQSLCTSPVLLSELSGWKRRCSCCCSSSRGRRHRNERASWLAGYEVCGDAILADVGSTRASEGALRCHDVTLPVFTRLMMIRNPVGAYRLSRGAPVASQLPLHFSSLRVWRGTSPKMLLESFCLQRSQEPSSCKLRGPSYKVLPAGRLKKLEAVKENSQLRSHDAPTRPEFEPSAGGRLSGPQPPGGQAAINAVDGVTPGTLTSVVARPIGPLDGPFKCHLEVPLEGQVATFVSAQEYRSSHDAAHSAALAALHFVQSRYRQRRLLCQKQQLQQQQQQQEEEQQHGLDSKVILREGSGTAVPSQGSLVRVDYALWLVGQGAPHTPPAAASSAAAQGPSAGPPPPAAAAAATAAESVGGGPLSGDAAHGGVPPLADTGAWPLSKGMGEPMEKNAGFEFEVGRGAVIAYLEKWVGGMTQGEVALYTTRMPASELASAVALCGLESAPDADQDGEQGTREVAWEVHLASLWEPPEERMEVALFSPPLAKQRAEFAMQLIRGCGATSVIDLGCGAGALLTQLASCGYVQRVAGVDTSAEDLQRAAKAMQSLLGKGCLAEGGSGGTKSAEPAVPAPAAQVRVQLYQGSIAEPADNFKGFDVATCLEVIEHLDEEPLAKVGDAILGGLRPKVCLVSTPNIEYNSIIESTYQDAVGQKDSGELEAKGQPNKANGTPRLRDEDHRFEWTRAQFEEWAVPLAERHGYSVDFGGVGEIVCGRGFASQMAIFKSLAIANELCSPNVFNQSTWGQTKQGLACEPIWQWPIGGDH